MVVDALVSEGDLRFKAVKILRAARNFMTLKDLSSLLGLSPSAISRYSIGRTLPSENNARIIIDTLPDKEVLG